MNRLFDLVYTVDILDSRDTTNLALLDRRDLGVTFTKLHCWRLTQYKKCVFLDADTLVCMVIIADHNRIISNARNHTAGLSKTKLTTAK